MSLPLDARVPDAELKRAREALAARQGGGGGVRGRRGRHRDRARPPRRRGDRARGQAPRRGGDRARRRGAHAHARRRAAGRQAAACTTTFVGETTRYVVNKAPCRVILTAPPGRRAALDPTTTVARRPPRPLGRRRGTGGASDARGGRPARVRASVRPRRRSRPRRLLRRHVGAAARATTSRCSTRTRSRTSASTSSSAARWEEAGGRFTIGTALEIDALIEAGHRARPTCSSPPPTATTPTSWSRRSPSGASTSTRVIARVLDPRRAAWYARAGRCRRSARPRSRSSSSSRPRSARAVRRWPGST